MPRRAHSLLISAILLTGGAFTSLHSQSTNAGADTVSRGEIRDISVTGPRADSPFYLERQEAKEATAAAGRTGYGMYVPKPPRTPAGEQISKFFRGMFAFGKGAKAGATPMVLNVDPSDFSLAQTPELDVSLKISNARKQEIELLYPDNQRLEVVTKDDSGNVVNRWSEDRVFDQHEGFVAINPEEFVIYAEKIRTSRMKPGQTYTVEASLANQQGYTAVKTVTVKP